jgi:hypothetical protein
MSQAFYELKGRVEPFSRPGIGPKTAASAEFPLPALSAKSVFGQK